MKTDVRKAQINDILWFYYSKFCCFREFSEIKVFQNSHLPCTKVLVHLWTFSVGCIFRSISEFCVTASHHVHILRLHWSIPVLFDSRYSSAMFNLEFEMCVFSFCLSVCGWLCTWVRGGGVCAPAILCRLNYKSNDVVSSSCIGCLYLVTHSLSLSFFLCIAIYSNCNFSLPLCCFPCFVILLFLHTHYLQVQANRSTYDIIMEKKILNTLPKGFLYFSFSLCWHSHFTLLAASFGVIVISLVVLRIVANLA